MKMNKLFLAPLMAALALASCTSEAPVFEDNIGDGGNGETNFLTINIVTTPNNNTRAGGEGDPDDAKYEEGYASENKVNSIRVYFFDNNGEAAAVKANGNNYVDIDGDKITDNGQDMPNVEKIIEATIVISTKEGDELPTQMVAILNHTLEGLDNNNVNLSTLRDRVKDYVATASVEEGAFVMMNSVYKSGTEIASTPVRKENYGTTETLAKENPVSIYVERPVAKVRVKFADNLNFNSTTKRIPLIKEKAEGENQSATNLMIDGKQVYLEVSGWNITAESNMSYLSKHIDIQWADDLFGTERWNWNPYFRSYWALNPNVDSFGQSWHDYNSIGSKGFDGSLANSIYTNENAPQDAASTSSSNAVIEKFTKVIIAGKLVYENGDPIEMVKYAGATLVGESNIKTHLLSILQNNGMIYSYTTDDETGKTTYASLTSEDVEFKTALNSEIDDVDESEKTGGRYNVYLQLSEIGAKKNWSKSNAQEQPADARFANETEVNTYLVKEFGNVQIYKGGLTYYYFPIRHLGDSGKTGFYGVVRNHIYDCTITSITGFGTPVYDPDEVIYPEKPVNSDTFIAASINILSWRVVPNNVELDW